MTKEILLTVPTFFTDEEVRALRMLISDMIIMMSQAKLNGMKETYKDLSMVKNEN